MKRLSSQLVEGMTIFGVGLAIGWFGTTLLEKAPDSFSPILLYILGLILVVLGVFYLYLGGAHSIAKE